MERFPVLDPMYQKQLEKAYYTEKRQFTKPQTREAKKSGSSEDSSFKRFWLFGRKPKVTAENFRIAAHHHPSFSLVPIEGLASLSRSEHTPYNSEPCANGESNMLKKETTKADATEREIEVDHIVSHQPQETLLQPIAESCSETNAYMEGFDNDAAILDEDEENICVTELSETGEETGRL